MPTYIDLSVPLENNPFADPPHQRVNIEYQAHAEGGKDLIASFPGLQLDDLPEGLGWAVEKVHISTHNGTHVDAPWHYHPTMDEGKRAITVDELPLHWFFQPGIKLDFRHFEDGYLVSSDDIRRELDRIEHELQPLEIVAVNTRAGTCYGTKEYVNSGCGMGRDATLFLAKQGVKVVGTDGWSWDAPFFHTARKFAATGDVSLIWEGHKAGMEVGYCQIEKMHNLEQLPSKGFHISCFPVKVAGGSAGWTRAVGIID
ncbi:MULTISPECIES: cyclase family protein [Paraburkholderia]|uniref:cyclase family protein n=1 Tax=Paraburkholderia TaxID=1822464 RepID=UPI0022578F5A|nr:MULTISPECIES: cyclase family protein [Paraburkholderia]MCX4163623.1 cyclase family protein [Paraburkholderia megapolitana]MDN7159118.1 cyclase family protein [Paraburkholderia sp. CHISQ3]MDQ6496165.1 cyclase family protein [Paraburkholderia megapolitana]